jgi:hypothetical protein
MNPSGSPSGEIRTGRKLCSKNARASPGLPGLAATALLHASWSAAVIGRAARDGLLLRRIALQLIRKAANAASWSSSAQPSI